MYLSLFSGPPGMPEVLLVVFVLVLLFGAKRLPELSRSIGRSISEFKKGRKEGVLSESEEEDKKEIEAKKDDT